MRSTASWFGLAIASAALTATAQDQDQDQTQVAAAAGETSQTRLMSAQSEEYGAYVADAEGRALYMFTADQQGADRTEARSDCYDACADAWPPLTAEGEPAVGSQLDRSLLGSLQREDGEMQVTYGGWPLYYFVRDQGPDSVAGQGVQGFGGEWYLVSPDGTEIETTAGEGETGQ